MSEFRPGRNLGLNIPTLVSSRAEKPAAVKEVKEKENALADVMYYLNAGGLGTRLESVIEKNGQLGITKAIIPFAGSPIVEYHLARALKLKYGAVTVAAGHHAQVKDYLNNGVSHEVGNGQYDVVVQEKQFGTGGDLILALRARSDNPPFVVIQNVDTLLDVRDELAVKQHKATQAGATIVLTSRVNVPNQGAFLCDFDNRVVHSKEAHESLRTPAPTLYARQGSSTGMVVVNTDLVVKYPWDETQGSLSLYSQMLGSWVMQGLVYGFDNADRFFMDIGTPTNYHKARRHPILKNILTTRVKT